MKTPRILLIAAGVIALAAVVWAALPATNAGTSLAFDLPPGALLTIESTDFGGLLHSWNASSEGTAWMKSANYSAFSNSRLFSRLGDAQGEFEGVAGGSGLGSDFLRQVAGKESIFAWYDISKLEFLYITRLPAGRAASIELLRQRSKFSRRESGGVPFYVNTSATAAGDADSGPSTTRTLAFATSGDWLLLATREDLMANALLLMQHPANGGSLATEGWYSATEAAGPAHHGDLHMLLDLQRITATPAFRTYWIQRNVTETRQYRAAVVDLYREGNVFREERSLLPMASADEAPQPDLSALENMVPERAGFYRAVAAPTSESVLASLDEKVFGRASTSATETVAAPAVDLTIPHAGSTSDLETRIDTLVPTAEPASSANAPLIALLQASSIDSMMTMDRTDAKKDKLFVPIHSAVILHAAQPWDRTKLQDALLTSLRARLTVSSIGLAWTPVEGASYVSLGSAHPVLLYVDAGTAVVANDAALIAEILAKHGGSVTQQPATLIAGFRHTQESDPFLKLTSSLALASGGQSTPDAESEGHAPDLLHDSVGSLSNAFQSLSSERIVERRDGAIVHQTVTYTWQKK